MDRDITRGYSINVKQVVLAFAVEFWIIGLIVIGTYLLIADSGHLSNEALFSALLFPAALAMVELARVPLAIAVRTQNAWHIKLLASLGVIAAVTVTSFSLSQIAWKTFDNRIAEATEANDRRTAVKAKLEALQQKDLETQRDIEQKLNNRAQIVERLRDLDQQLTKITSAAGKVCRTQLDGQGRPMSSCSFSATINMPQLNTLKAEIANANKKLEQAETDLKETQDRIRPSALERQGIGKDIADAEAAYRVAVNKSQLHSYTGMVLGKAVSEVTEAEVKNLEKYLVIIPSIAAALASTLIAITAVRRIGVPKESPLTTLPDNAAEYLFGPLITAIRKEARDAVNAAIEKGVADESSAKSMRAART